MKLRIDDAAIGEQVTEVQKALGVTDRTQEVLALVRARNKVKPNPTEGAQEALQAFQLAIIEALEPDHALTSPQMYAFFAEFIDIWWEMMTLARERLGQMGVSGDPGPSIENLSEPAFLEAVQGFGKQVHQKMMSGTNLTYPSVYVHAHQFAGNGTGQFLGAFNEGGLEFANLTEAAAVFEGSTAGWERDQQWELFAGRLEGAKNPLRSTLAIEMSHQNVLDDVIHTGETPYEFQFVSDVDGTRVESLVWKDWVYQLMLEMSEFVRDRRGEGRKTHVTALIDAMADIHAKHWDSFAADAEAFKAKARQVVEKAFRRKARPGHKRKPLNSLEQILPFKARCEALTACQDRQRKEDDLFERYVHALINIVGATHRRINQEREIELLGCPLHNSTVYPKIYEFYTGFVQDRCHKVLYGVDPT